MTAKDCVSLLHGANVDDNVGDVVYESATPIQVDISTYPLFTHIHPTGVCPIR